MKKLSRRWTFSLKNDMGNPLFRDWKAKFIEPSGKDLTEALTCQNRELAEEYPQIATVWVAYGNLLRHLGKQEEAIAAYRKANEQAGILIDAYMRLADLKTLSLFPRRKPRACSNCCRPTCRLEERANL